MPGAALAQQATADQGPIEEVVVTAEKTSTTLQRVPAAVTAVSGDELVSQGATGLTSLSQFAPSLDIEPVRTETNIFIRGVGQTLTSPGSDPAVVVNVNGAYVPSEMSGVSFYDISRVEVLPGPQGTLYGRNSVGGVINVITRQPGSSFGGEGFLEYGNFNSIHGFAALDVPLSDNFAVRAAVNVVKHDGYYSNGVDDQDSIGVRLTGVWQPTDKTKIIGIVSYDHDGGLGDVAQNIPPPTGNFWKLGFDPHAAGLKSDFKTVQASLEVDQQLTSNIDLTYIGSFNHLDAFQNTTFWAGPPLTPLIVSQGVTDTSHEARLDATWGRFKNMLGVYYFDSSLPFNGTLYFPPVVSIHQGPISTSSRGEAVFGQTTFEASDDLRFTGGLRYSTSTRTLNGVNTTMIGAFSIVDAYSGKTTNDHVDWKVAGEYDINPQSMLYANVATGFSPGGFSIASVAIGSTQAAPFLPMRMTGYTIGIKNRFFDDRLTANLEGFAYDYSNYQVSQRNPSTGQNQVYNAKKASSYGAQLELDFSPTPDDLLSFKPAYLSAIAQTLITPAGDFSGEQLPYAPDWTVNASYQHTFHLTDGASITGLVSFQYVDSQWAFYTHAAGGHIPGVTRTDVDLTYHFSDDRWAVSLWGRNLENSLVLTSGISGAAPGPAAFFAAPPRTYGVRVSFSDD